MATVRGEVLHEDGHAIPGLFAAGACVSSIPLDGKGYASEALAAVLAWEKTNFDAPCVVCMTRTACFNSSGQC